MSEEESLTITEEDLPRIAQAFRKSNYPNALLAFLDDYEKDKDIRKAKEIIKLLKDKRDFTIIEAAAIANLPLEDLKNAVDKGILKVNQIDTELYVTRENLIAWIRNES